MGQHGQKLVLAPVGLPQFALRPLAIGNILNG
jgi:hypothetical protein